jgi:endoribonuclease Dicer
MARRFQVGLLSLLMDHDFAKLEEVTGQLLSFEKQLSSSSSCSSKEVCYLLLPCIEGRIDWAAISSPNLIFNKMLNKTAEAHHLSSCKIMCGLVQTRDATFFTCMLKNSIVYTAHNGYFYFVDGILESVNANSYFDLRNGESVTYKSYYKSK